MEQGGQAADVVQVAVGQHQGVGVSGLLGERPGLGGAPLRDAAVDQQPGVPEVDHRHGPRDLVGRAQQAHLPLREAMHGGGGDDLTHGRPETNRWTKGGRLKQADRPVEPFSPPP